MERTTVLAWGSNQDGQLGFGSTTELDDNAPRVLHFFQQQQLHVVQIACGQKHTLFVMLDGSVWSCGTNEHGQLGREHNGGSLKKPGLVDSLKHHNIVQAAAGLGHSLALSDGGQIFSWGGNASGQCGRDSDPDGLRVPKLIRYLAHEYIVQICCGDEFSMALDDAGNIYVWGKNVFGQLGIGHKDSVTTPQTVKSLVGLPVQQISAGAAHAVVLSKSGSAYSTGKNDFGQLGVGDQSERSNYSTIKSFKNQRVCYLACGEEHSVALTTDGGVFTFGAGGHGQLGHGPTHSEVNPRKVFELMGSTVTQICVGRFHTITYVAASNKLFVFGKGGAGQLGTGSRINHQHPVICSAAFELMRTSGLTMCELFAGGDQSFATVALGTAAPSPVDFRDTRPRGRMLVLTEKTVGRLVASLDRLGAEEEMLGDVEQRELEVMCGSVAAWNGAFLGPGEEHFYGGSRNCGVDLPVAERELERLAAVMKTNVREDILDKIRQKVIRHLPSMVNPASIECLRVFLTLPLFPVFAGPLDADRVIEYIVPFAGAISHLAKEPDRVLRSWLSIVPLGIFDKYVQLYKSSVVIILNMPDVAKLIQKEAYWKGAQSLLDALAVLYDANNRLRIVSEFGALLHEKFYIPEITDKVNIMMDYKNWHHADARTRSMTLSFCNYAFTFDPQAKTILLQADSMLQMEEAVNSMNHYDFMQNFIRAAAQGVSGAAMHPQQVVFLNLYVSRNDLLKDTLDQIWNFKERGDLKRPLKVWFAGEDAEDAGGVKKEFFMLLMRELLDPKYGMFTYYEDARSIYFNGNSFESKDRFYMVGIICGLAIYNATIVDVHFPLVLYKKLLGIKPILQDLDGLMPTVRRSLEQLLQYDGDDFDDVFALNFTLTQEFFGERVIVPLKPDGENIGVTKDNRQEYVDLYVDYVLNRAVQDQFKAFYEGFHRVCGGEILQLFHPQELMAMVCGNENYDWKELEQAAVYKGDFSADHPTIKMFWRVFHSLDLEAKKKFLLFLTGCDRIPILGMKSVRVVIQPAGGGETYLPVAHTCFNILDLPKYTSESLLRQKLLLAMQQFQGFALA